MAFNNTEIEALTRKGWLGLCWIYKKHPLTDSLFVSFDHPVIAKIILKGSVIGFSLTECLVNFFFGQHIFAGL